jgi:hypothetical protein
MNKKEKGETLSVKQILELTENLESAISVTHICEIYEHLAISDTPLPN